MKQSFASDNSIFGIHVVQVSHDIGILDTAKDREPYERQLAYAQELDQQRPGSEMSILILTYQANVQPTQEKNLRIVPVDGGSLGRRLKLWPALWRLHHLRPIDVITTQTVFDEAGLVLLFAKLVNARVIGQIHWDIFSEVGQRDSLRRFTHWRYRFALSYMQWFFTIRAVGQRTAQTLRERGIHHRVAVIPVAMPLIAHADLPISLPQQRRVLFVGRLASQKNLGLWLEIAAQVAKINPAAQFEWVGTGDQRLELEQQIADKQLQDRVVLRGLIPHADLVGVYQQADCLLLTSHYEGFGRVVAEALACGVPVVAPRIAGVEDIVDEGISGFLHHPGDSEGMINSVLYLLANPEHARTMGKAGRQKVLAQFSPEMLIQQWVNLLVSSSRVAVPQLQWPKLRTLRRWKEIGFSGFTLLRSLEYESIRGLQLEGKVLDLGGGEKTSYRDLLTVQGQLDSINVNPIMKPTILADLNQPLPLADEIYDHIISLNTLEHLYHDEQALIEGLRVLRHGGTFHLIIPFLYQVHGSPMDFHRHTADWWSARLIAAGISNTSFVIEPLVWDRLASAFSFIGGGRLRWLKPLITLIGVIADRLTIHRSARRRGRRAASDLQVVLGYYIHGSK